VTGIVGDSVDPLRAAREKPAVLIFVRTDCPVSNRYAPEIERLYRSYSPRGIIFWLVYPDPDTKLAEIKQHLQEYGLDVPTLRDPKHTLVRASGVSVTPEVAVLIPPASKLVYRGRIDDRMADFGKERPQARERDLEQVLEEIVSGKTVAPRTTRAIGCYISDFD
jgi:peroxiredoxin